MNVPLTPEQAAEAKHLEEKIRQVMAKDIEQLARLVISKPERELFGNTEYQMRDILIRAGAKVYEEYLREKKNGYYGPGVDCPHCGQSAKFHGYREVTPLSILGPIRLRRAYYYCHRCGGTVPWDEVVGLDKRLTPAAQELVSLAGTISNSFAEAADKVLPKMAGVHLSESAVQRTSEAAGQRLSELLEKRKVLGGPTPYDWHKDAHGKTCAYVSIDSTGVPQQAKGGGAAEGRMPYVAMVFNPVPDLPADHPHRLPASAKMQARYLSGLLDLDELGERLRRQAGQVGMNRAEQWIGLTDGGNGLERFVQGNFNRSDLVLILDFYHASEYLTNLARTMHPTDEEERQALGKSWCHTMKHQGGAGILAELEKLELPRRPAVREQYETTVGYIRNNLHRMDYPRYEANGWCIGSGSMESACKTVVGQRLKLAGMRWRENGTNEMCHLRALHRSDPAQWDLFWSRSIN